MEWLALLVANFHAAVPTPVSSHSIRKFTNVLILCPQLLASLGQSLARIVTEGKCVGYCSLECRRLTSSPVPPPDVEEVDEEIPLELSVSDWL